MISETSRSRVGKLAKQLEAKSTIPTVQAQLQLIQDIQTQEFW
ncbi:hypothetical protein [Vibrio halioticoli]|nr:hypothetical protein [Vibrio halioticoli]